MDTDENKPAGRRGLFMVTEDDKKQPEKDLVVSDYTEIINRILNYKQGEFPEVPEEFVPILNRLQQDTEILQNEKQAIQELSRELDQLKEEQVTIKKEHESYLSDLISAHTEFDRALEIFQYHAIPMVLLGPEQQIMDANDIFCSIFSVERSEITRHFPPITKYVSDTSPFSAPDGNQYSIVTIKPPIVPFDHEAVSLELFIPYLPPVEPKTRETISREIFEKALSEILLPIAILDEHNTVKYLNNAFLEYLARDHQDIYLRDIASCGFSGEIKEKVEEAVTTGTKIEYQTSILHRDNTSIQVWIELFPLTYDEETYILLVLFPDEEEENNNNEKFSQNLSEIRTPFLKTLLDLNPSPMVLFNDASEIILANEGLSELIGVSSGQLQGQKLPDIGIQVSGFSGMSEEMEILPDDVCIESPYGMECYSGLLIANHQSNQNQYLLILQPPVDAPIQQDLQKSHEIIEPVQDGSPSFHTEVDIHPDDFQSIQFSAISIPGLLIEESVIKEMNQSFKEWSGIQDENISEYAQILISHAVQARENRSVVFSSLYPAGLKSYQIQIQPNISLPDTNIYWFIDQSEAQETIASLQNQIESLQSELTIIKNNLQEERSAMKTSDDISGQIDIVEFELSGARYAMDIGMVREVVEMLPITPLPKTPPYIIGIINLRGEVTHVIDLAVLLGERIKKDRSGQKIIIVPPDAAHGEHLGIIVDNVRSVTEIGARQVTALGDEINERIQTRIKGIIKVTHDDLIEKREGEEKEANLVIWLDMKEILNRIASLH
ncbi:chemotaxis protein CheW [Methanospirillum hungatei]|uniref:chemotaxis protein CheW n=1 Tax=Methanospirillum hungatei TaxID=2203 RepID=UPI0026EE1614|nr:chemotaxis protein CheW [Methanospirillum hungatei]MCA1917238.1 chemotaxis protein CheW [Methanospirillum hungatei]